jgi:peptide-methionine (S)-S-oxide reductase
MKQKVGIFILLLVVVFTNSCNSNEKGIKMNKEELKLENYSQATLGAGCFWCVEAVFQRIEGVVFVESGYSNGHVNNPTYEQVCSGNTGHAEVARIYFDENKVSFREILEIFFKTHDPTTLNKQGNDIGTQYRSGIYYHNEEQKKIAEEMKDLIDKSGIYSKSVVTEIVPISNYYMAEDYHQNYYNDNKNQPYCSFVITPKIDKLEKLFKEKLKK